MEIITERGMTRYIRLCDIILRTPSCFFEWNLTIFSFSFDSVAAVESVQNSGKICILDIDVQGVQNVKKSTLDPIYIFIAPPSAQALEERLRGRGTESEEDIQKRLANAAREIEYGRGEGNFDRIFVNDDLTKTFEKLARAFRQWYPHLKQDYSPRPVVVCGPSGVGKGTIIKMLMERFPDGQFGFSVSHTTRKPRDGEVDGQDYNFTTVEQMKKEISEGKFIEYAEVHGNYYGTRYVTKSVMLCLSVRTELCLMFMLSVALKCPSRKVAAGRGKDLHSGH